MQNHKISLPIDDYLEEINLSLSKSNRILLKASPGSGKTTRLPWFLARSQKGKILVLEPRRIAAKLAAVRIAQENSLQIGEEIGYRFRYENEISDHTKLLFFTEGTFLKTFKELNLEEFSVIILDEFHERHLESDLALSLLIEKQKEFPHLKIILMSATLDLALREYLGDAITFDINVRKFEVEIEYLPNIPSVLNDRLDRKILNCLNQTDPTKDVLIFLPGMKEIRQVQEYISPFYNNTLILHGDLSKEEQSLVFEKSHKRKIILSTNIAESSVTIPGIRVVIDSGIQRESIYENWTGLKQLQDRPTTQDSAIQRAGRAGREDNGKCFRLYSKIDYENRTEFSAPAILKEDLLETYLYAISFNSPLKWPTTPNESAWLKAQSLAESLGLAHENKLTPVGEKVLEMPTQIRIGNILQRSKHLSAKSLDNLLNFISMHFESENPTKWKTRIRKIIHSQGNDDNWEKCLLHGFIDQVAKYRPEYNDFIHYSGKIIKASQKLENTSAGLYLILAVSRKVEANLIVPIEEEWLYEFEPFALSEETKVSLQDGSVFFRQTLSIGRVVLEETYGQKEWKYLNSDEKEKTLLVCQKKFDDALNEFKKSKFFKKYLLGFSNEKITFSLEEYFEENGRLEIHSLDDYFRSKLSSLNIDHLYPDKILLKNKKEFIIHYDDSQIYLESYIQDFYGLDVSPTLNQIPLTLKLLGPHKRALQVTKDLMSFWNNGYKEILKELKREYPRHHWADDPTKALPILLKRQLP